MNHCQDAELLDTNVQLARHEEGMPTLDSLSESEESDSSSSIPKQTAPFQRPCEKKRVSWDRIHTREFSLVVGDHPFCQDGLPVSLGWHHADNPEPCRKITCTESLSERRTSYNFPKRMSYEERKRRICSVSGLTDDEVKNDEIDLVVRTLQEGWRCVEGGGETRLLIDPTPIAEQDCTMMQAWDDFISHDIDLDLGDMSDFEWTD